MGDDTEDTREVRERRSGTVFFTGATGYVGSAVAVACSAAGYEIHALARSEDSAARLQGLGYVPYRGDMRRRGELSRAILDSGSVAVVHAATTGDSEAEDADRTAVGDVLDALRGSGGTFVYTSGGWVMGETPGSPEEEPADEDTPVEPAPALRRRSAGGLRSSSWS